MSFVCFFKDSINLVTDQEITEPNFKSREPPGIELNSIHVDMYVLLESIVRDAISSAHSEHEEGNDFVSKEIIEKALSIVRESVSKIDQSIVLKEISEREMRVDLIGPSVFFSVTCMEIELLAYLSYTNWLLSGSEFFDWDNQPLVDEALALARRDDISITDYESGGFQFLSDFLSRDWKNSESD
jgi:hypothetical protein